METEEYKSTYSLLTEAISCYDKKARKLDIVAWTSHTIIVLISCLLPITIILQDEFWIPMAIGFILIILIGGCCIRIYNDNEYKYRRKFLLKYVLERNVCYNKEEMHDIIDGLWKGMSEQDVSQRCIVAYRKKHGLPINYKYI